MWHLTVTRPRNCIQVIFFSVFVFLQSSAPERKLFHLPHSWDTVGLCKSSKSVWKTQLSCAALLFFYFYSGSLYIKSLTHCILCSNEGKFICVLLTLEIPCCFSNVITVSDILLQTFHQTCEGNLSFFFLMFLQKRKRKEKEDDTVSLSSFDLKVRLRAASRLSDE